MPLLKPGSPGIVSPHVLRGLEDRLEHHQLKDQKGFYEDAVAPRNDRHGGYIALDGKVVAQTKQCPHCSAHFVMRKGSGTVRHFCPNCSQVTCGAWKCQPAFCKTWEKQMEEIEAADQRRREVESWLSR